MTVGLATLPNGLRIVTDRIETVATVSLGLWIDVGTRHEPAKINGVAHFLEHMAFKGTKRRSALAIAAFRRDGVLPADDQAWQAAAQYFAGHRADDSGTLAEIGNTYKLTGMLIDPHTAVAVSAARAQKDVGPRGEAPMVALATAHPAKFADAVERATGIRPPLPPVFAEIMEKPEQITVLPNDITTVARFIRERARLQARAA